MSQSLVASHLFHWLLVSRLTSSELQSQEEATYACPAFTTTGVLFAANAVKFASAVTQSS